MNMHELFKDFYDRLINQDTQKKEKSQPKAGSKRHYSTKDLSMPNKRSTIYKALQGIKAQEAAAKKEKAEEEEEE